MAWPWSNLSGCFDGGVIFSIILYKDSDFLHKLYQLMQHVVGDCHFEFAPSHNVYVHLIGWSSSCRIGRSRSSLGGCRVHWKPNMGSNRLNCSGKPAWGGEQSFYSIFVSHWWEWLVCRYGRPLLLLFCISCSGFSLCPFLPVSVPDLKHWKSFYLHECFCAVILGSSVYP